MAGSGQGGYADGIGAAAEFNWLTGVAVDSAGNVYVADTSNHRIRRITGREVSTIAGSGAGGYADGIGAEAKFNWLTDVAVDSVGNVYVADFGNHLIQKIEYRVLSLGAKFGDIFQFGEGNEKKYRR